MRWQELFDDLESQAEAEARWQDEAAVAELAEAERGRILLADRIRGGLGRRLAIGVDGESHRGTVVEATRTWFVLRTDARDVLIPASAVRWVEGAGRVAPEPGVAESRLSIGHVLRRLAAEEATVRVAFSGRVVVGRIDRTGLDHVDLVGEDGGASIAIPFSAIDSVAL